MKERESIVRRGEAKGRSKSTLIRQPNLHQEWHTEWFIGDTVCQIDVLQIGVDLQAAARKKRAQHVRRASNGCCGGGADAQSRFLDAINSALCD